MAIDGRLYLDTDYQVTVRFTDVAGNIYDSATVQVTLYESDGTTEVGGQTWPLSLSYEEWTEDGETRKGYRGTVEDTIEADENTVYHALLEIEASGLRREQWKRLYATKDFD